MLTDKLRIELLENWTQKQAEELKHLREQLEGKDSEKVALENLEVKVKAATTEIDSLKQQVKEVNTDLDNQSGDKKAITLSCEHCDVKFNKAIDLETHMEEHGLVKKHSCDLCEKKFHLKWRLKKHEQNHTKDSRAGYCHYYNNQKECPFVNAGCMFKHVKSGLCQNKNCTRPLCQFEHRDVTLEEVILDVDEEEETEQDDEYFELCAFQCHLCRKHCSSQDDNIDHVRKEHVEYFEEMMEITASFKNSY